MVQENQNIFDYCLQTYGTLENMIDDLLKNNDLTFQSELNAGQQLIISLNKGNEDIKSFIKINNFVIANVSEQSESELSEPFWILATGFWNDSGTWIDSKVWID